MRSATVILFSALAMLSSMQVSCSSGPKPAAESRAEMPQNYSVHAIDTLEQIAANVPSDADLIVFGSYGSIADSIRQFRDYHIVDDAELDKLLQDLGTHYQLNPSSLQSYYKAGMDSGSGFAAGKRGNNVFAVMRLLDETKFRTWWDVFINEEFGRPRYHESSEGNRRFVKIEILQKDFATMLFEPNQPVRIVFGSEIVPGSDDSLETIKALTDAPSLKDSDVLSKIREAIPTAPVGLWTSTAKTLLTESVSNMVAPWISNACAGVDFSKDGPSIQASGFWKNDIYENQKRGEYAAAMLKLQENTGQAHVLSSNPGSVGRIVFDAEKLESFVVPQLREKHQKQYADIKDKLTQRLLGLDVTHQIIHNLSAFWVAIYDTSTEPSQENPTIQEILSVQEVAVFMAFKDASASNAFFGKVNALMNIFKNQIPQDTASISQEGDLIHIAVKVSGATLHVGYRKGILSIATEPAWTTVKSVLENDAPKAADGILPAGNHFGLISLRIADVKQILGARYPIIKEQISRFLEHFPHMLVQASANENLIELRLNSTIKPNNP